MKNKKDVPLVSVILIAYNEEKNISGCISSIIDQEFSDFELIVVDDGSRDHTKEEVRFFKDRRIRLYSHETNLGFASARNTGLKRSCGRYIFFTDADCIVDKMWITSGLNAFKKSSENVGVYGRVDWRSYSERSITDMKEYKRQSIIGHPGTLNIAYRKDAFDKVGFFDERFNIGYEDCDIWLRMKLIGKVSPCSDMKVVHLKKNMTLKIGLKFLKRRKILVYLIKKHSRNYPDLRRSKVCYGFIVAPYYFFSLFPPMIFLAMMEKGMRIRSIKDILFLPVFYFGILYQRLHIWHAAIKEKVFLI